MALRLARALGNFADEHALGEVLAAETGFLLSRPGEPETVLAPDAAFVAASHLPAPGSPDATRYARLAPDLVVEVASPGQRGDELAARARIWREAGVRLVWLVLPDREAVEVYAAGHTAPVRVLGRSGWTAARCFPGFATRWIGSGTRASEPWRRWRSVRIVPRKRRASECGGVAGTPRLDPGACSATSQGILLVPGTRPDYNPTRSRAMLEKEREYYERNRSEWLGRYPGRFVLVRGETLEGVYDTHEQAMSEGARRFGLGPYLIRRVEATEPEIRVPALTLGLIHANPDGAVGESGTGA